MSRLATKCFVGSATLHSLLLLIVLLGSAFMGSKKPEALPPVITMLATPTDRMLSTGGSPKGNPDPPAPAPQPKVEEPVVPPQPQPKPPEPVKPEPVKEEPKDPPKKEVAKNLPKEKSEIPPKKPANDKPKDTASARNLTNSVVKLNPAQAKAAADRARADRIAADKRAQAAADAKARAQQQAMANAVKGIIGGVGKSLSQSTVVAPLGPGGEAFANYGSLIREAYDRAWIVPPSLTDDDSVAKAEVVISRDGRVLSASIISRSGNSVLDKSVSQALDAVKSVPPFPQGATDAKRTFTINFNLRAKRFSA